MSEPLQYACDEHGWCDYKPCPQCYPASELAQAAGWDALVDESISVLTDVSQLLDGWHSDGTCWSEWDEQVRKRVSTLQQKLYAEKYPNE